MVWTIGNYGREAAAFFNWETGINKWVNLFDNWEQLRPRSGRLLFNNYGRAAVAFLLGNWKLRSRSGRFHELGNWHQ